MPQIILDPGTPVEVFAAASLTAGARVAITPLGYGRVEVSESPDFTTYEVIQNDLTGYSRDVLSTPAGQESVLAPNTTYLYEITNLDDAPQAFSGYYTWYEGEPGLPLV